MRIRNRIILPFFLLFAVVFGVAAAISVYFVSNAVEERIVSQMNDLARFISGAKSFPLTQQSLKLIDRAFNARIALVDAGARKVVVSTFDDAEAAELVSLISAEKELLRRSSAVEIKLGTTTYQVVSSSIVSPEYRDREIAICLFFPGDVMEKEKSRAIAPLVITALSGAAVLLVVGFVIAHRISRPIVELSVKAKEIATGKIDVPLSPPGMSGEIGELTESFNTMVNGLKAYREKLLQSQKLVDMAHISAGIAHEIRNPLTSIKLTAQMLARDNEGRDRESFDLLIREIEMIELAVSELFSAAHASRMQFAEADISAVVNDLLAILGRQIEHLGVSVVKELGGRLPAKIDEKKFKRAIMNIVLNGAEASAGDGRRIAVSAKRMENGDALVTVKDSGKGIPVESRERIFEPFYTTKSDGVGLGLAVTKKIIEDHHGSLWFESSPQGTTFFIRIPGA